MMIANMLIVPHVFSKGLNQYIICNVHLAYSFDETKPQFKPMNTLALTASHH